MFKQRLKRKMVALLCRAIQSLRMLFFRLLSNNCPQGKPICYQPLQTIGKGQIVFGKNVRIGCFPSPLFFSSYGYIEARNPSSKISIGENTWINNNFSVIAEHTNIRIGRDCLIGTNVEIVDSDFHGIKVSERSISNYEMAKPVIIEDDVFIGSNVKILKGSIIGRGSIIANGAIVTGKIPTNVIAGGMPAKVLRVIEQ
jgi:acetyltransferase-like isoleucine patch superfamily enzyme